MQTLEDRRIKLTLHYDGAAYYGWQVQPDVPTVQSELEAALSRLTDRPTKAVAAGRTDRGVHATGQVASTLVPGKWTAAKLHRALNAVLPNAIWVAAAEEVPESFHARYDAVARGYTYRVGTAGRVRSPFLRPWCWSLAEPLDLEALGAAASKIRGDHSFRAFAKSGQPERGERCIVHRAHWTPWDGIGVAFHVAANRFLHHMVRYLVGTMVDIARGRRRVTDIDALLQNDPDQETSPPAPAEGLFFTRVYYDESDLRDEETSDEDLP